ncbi:MAG: hypothetical protein HY658_12175 [Actinobacteria bacterium]|nr:hypothetical protein [Actinomycetota bacterium]
MGDVMAMVTRSCLAAMLPATLLPTYSSLDAGCYLLQPFPEAGLALNAVPDLGLAELLGTRFEVSVADNYALVGLIGQFGDDSPSTEAEFDQRIEQLLQDWIDRKRASIGSPGVDPSLAQSDLEALQAAAARPRPYDVTGYEVRVETSAALPSGLTAAPIGCPEDSPEQQVPMAVCPEIFFFCPKDRDDRKWAADHGYWDLHWWATSGPWAYHGVWMDVTWSTNSRLSLYTGDNDGFEVNTALTYAPQGSQIIRDDWASDMPGAYREEITLDDSAPTFAIGSDRAEYLVSGREYQNLFIFYSQYILDNLPMRYYQQVDLDMAANGDLGFYSDDSCGGEMTSCPRNGTSGPTRYQRW